METLISKLLNNWQHKLVAIGLALSIWLFVHSSITSTKTIPGVPIRIVNLPPDKTIQGLLPKGVLNKRITLTLSGTKSVIRELEPGDLEVLINAADIDLEREDWVVVLKKNNLVSLSPDIDLAHNITDVAHTEFILKISRLVTAKVPVNILAPIGETPEGYELLDVWPQKLMQTLSGPEDAINHLKTHGLELVFDLNQITRAELDAIQSAHLNHQNDEISFYIPNHWKEVGIPFHNNMLEEINDPLAQYLRIDFLKKEFLPIEKEFLIRAFFPLKNITQINPQKLTFATSEKIKEKNGVFILSQQLFTQNVSRLFTDIIKPYLEIVIVASPKTERDILEWSVEVVAAQELEDIYVAYFIGEKNDDGDKQNALLLKQLEEPLLRKRFRDYLQKLKLYTSPNQKLYIDSFIEGNQIKVKS
jgi:hypothetical protein